MRSCNERRDLGAASRTETLKPAASITGTQALGQFRRGQGADVFGVEPERLWGRRDLPR